MFKKAVKSQSKLRLLLEGVSGCGKTYSALELAQGLGKKIAVIDTENGSAALYANKFDFDVVNFQEPYSPTAYVKLIKEAERLQYDVIIIDSITHEWSGPGGCLEIANQSKGLLGWKTVSPMHNKFLQTILASPCHIIATARTKADYQTDEAMGQTSTKSRIRKVGTKTEQKDGLDFEFTTVLRLNNEFFEVMKDRTGIFEGRSERLTADHARELVEWLNDGESLKDQADALLEKMKDIKTKEELREFYSDVPLNIRPMVEEEFKKYAKKLDNPKATDSDEIKISRFKTEQYKQQVETCHNLDELKDIWLAIDAPYKKLLEGVKEERKNKLTKAN